MQVRAVVVSASLVARDTAHLAHNPCKVDFHELEKIAIERSLVPIGAADRLNDIGVRQGSVGGREQP